MLRHSVKLLSRYARPKVRMEQDLQRHLDRTRRINLRPDLIFKDISIRYILYLIFK